MDGVGERAADDEVDLTLSLGCKAGATAGGTQAVVERLKVVRLQSRESRYTNVRLQR